MNEMFSKKTTRQNTRQSSPLRSVNLFIGFGCVFISLIGVFAFFGTNNIVASANTQEVKLLLISSKTQTESESLLVSENLSIQKPEEIVAAEIKKPKKAVIKR